MDLVQFLNYGAAGFCAILSILCWRLISAEQKRSQNPRKAILQTCYVFMGFCLVLSVLMCATEIRKNTAELKDMKTRVQEYDALDAKLNAKNVECATAVAQVQSLTQLINNQKDTLDYMKTLLAQATSSGEEPATKTAASPKPVPTPVGSAPTPTLAHATKSTKLTPQQARAELNTAIEKMLAESAKVAPKK
jgi:hypothetical protein